MTTVAAAQAEAQGITMKPESSNDGTTSFWVLVIAAMTVGLAFGWQRRGHYDRATRSRTLHQPMTRTMATQSPTKYTWWHEQPRFTPIGDGD